jgi:predicted MPP superfamily phosphohydrolase
MTYLFLAVLALDILRLANLILPFYPASIRQHYSGVKTGLLLSVSGLVVLALIAGFVNASIPRVRALTCRIPKRADGIRSLTVAVASDIHLGTIVGRKRFDRIVEGINALDADLVLLPGDIVDEDLGAVIRENLGESLKNLRSKYGVVAITGNHEYIGGVDKACAYLAAHGVTVLRDGVLRVNGGVFLVGREDQSIHQFSGMRRKPLKELMAGVDKRYPVILLDHQPFHLEDGAANGADVQLSGHTHHGQLWPFNYITAAIYEVSWGYKKIGPTHVYVSSGVGTWGPPVRIGNRPEIVHLTLTFD